MRIHANSLTENDFHDAARRAGVTIIKLDPKGSKSRARAFDVALTGSGVQGGMYGNLGYRTATWDEWGMMLSRLFNADSSTFVPRVYESAEHFHWATGDRFTMLTPLFARYRHKWLRNGTDATGAYCVSECRDCGAINRWMAPGRQFSELQK